MGGAIFSAVIYVVIAVFAIRKLRQIKGGNASERPTPVQRQQGNLTAPPVRTGTAHRKVNNGVNTIIIVQT